MSAIDLNARASSDFDAKLAETIALLQLAALDYAPLTAGNAARITQASSLGAEDVVISHLINMLQLNIGIFVLETGMLHPETLALLDRLKATSRAPVEVFTPVNEAVVQFVSREGNDAMYKSIELRKACCGIRKMEPLARALNGKAAWITGLRREQSGARADVPLIDTSDATASPTPLAANTPPSVASTSGSSAAHPLACAALSTAAAKAQKAGKLRSPKPSTAMGAAGGSRRA